MSISEPFIRRPDRQLVVDARECWVFGIGAYNLLPGPRQLPKVDFPDHPPSQVNYPGASPDTMAFPRWRRPLEPAIRRAFRPRRD